MSANGGKGDDQGALSPPEGGGTPLAVDVSGDLSRRWIWAMFLAGPVVWFTHFILVYLVTEAGCTAGGPGLRNFDPPVPVLLTLISTVIAAGLAAAAAVWAFGHWRGAKRELEMAPDDVEDLAGEHDDDRRRGTLAFAGFVLSIFSVVAILFTGAPALLLGPC